jgi:DNA-binding PadR family transcriptional regulator
MVAHPPYDRTGVSGTTLNQQIEQRQVKQWTRLSFSSVYYVLNQLEKKGLVKSKVSDQVENSHPNVGAPQKLFLVTTKGREILKSTVKEYFSRSNLNYKETNLALAASFVFTDEEFLETLKSHKKSLEERIAIVQRRYSEDRDGIPDVEIPIHFWALFNYAFYALNARMNFLDKLIVKLNKKIKSNQEK